MLHCTVSSHKQSHIERSSLRSVINFTNSQLSRYENVRETQFIKQTIKKRRCNRFVGVTLNEQSVERLTPLFCQCGGKKSKHSESALASSSSRDNSLPDPNTAHAEPEAQSPSSGGQWRPERDTVELPTDAFGEIQFKGTKNVGKYVRVSNTTSMETILELLLRRWDLPIPALLISITGGAKNFHLPKKKGADEFKQALMKVAVTTGAWILTGGTHTGVMRHVGDAVRDFSAGGGAAGVGIGGGTGDEKIVTIGVATWGIIQNKEELVSEDGLGKWPANYRVTKAKQGKSPLDPNHSHFILIDDGTQGRFGREIKFRSEMEKSISELKTSRGSSAVTVPVVCMALEGGPGTMETIYQSVSNGTPVVVVNGSGRAADIIAYAYKHSKEVEVEVTDRDGVTLSEVQSVIEPRLDAEIVKRVEIEFGSKNLHTIVDWVKGIVAKRNYVSVIELMARERTELYETNDCNDMDLAILRALLKANKNCAMDQLKLALAWNRVDVVTKEIFTRQKLWEKGSLDNILYTAILENKVDFVRVLLENPAVNLTEFATVERLLHLYNDIPKHCILFKMLENFRNKVTGRYVSLPDVGFVIRELMGDFYYPLYLVDERYRDTFQDENSMQGRKGLVVKHGAKRKPLSARKNRVMAALHTHRPPSAFNLPIRNINSLDNEFLNETFDSPARELFIWCVLMGRRSLASLFMSEGRHPLASALMASRLQRRMGESVKGADADKSLECDDLAEFFEDEAIAILNQCNEADERRAERLLILELPTFGCCTCLQLAVEAKNERFISHHVCQMLLSSIWYGEIDRENMERVQLGLVRILAASFFFFLIPSPLIHFVKDKFVNMETSNSRDSIADLKVSSNKDPLTNINERTSNDYLTQGSQTIDGPNFVTTNGVGHNANKEATSSSNSGVAFNLVSQPSAQEHLTFIKPAPLWKIRAFYHAPITIFILNQIFHLLYLILFSYVLLCELFETRATISEWILIGSTFTVICEEFRQIFDKHKAIPSHIKRKMTQRYHLSSLNAKLHSYWRDQWNQVDVVAFGSFILGYVLRGVRQAPTLGKEAANVLHNLSRVLLTLSLFTFFVRLLHSFSVHQNLGPKVVMIKRMMNDVVFFIFILVVFLIAYGVASHSLLYPEEKLDLKLVNNILRKAYWNIYGELFLEKDDSVCNVSTNYMEGVVDEFDGGPVRCISDWGKHLAPILLGIYMLFTNILLLNLLIAMFSFTFEKVQENTDRIWKYQRYHLIYEYFHKPPIPPPFIVFYHLFLLYRNIAEKCCYESDDSSFFKLRIPESELRQYNMWEEICADSHSKAKILQSHNNIDNKVTGLSKRVEMVFDKLEDHMERVKDKSNVPPQPNYEDSSSSAGDADRLSRIETQMQQVQETLISLSTRIPHSLDSERSSSSALPWIKACGHRHKFDLLFCLDECFGADSFAKVIDFVAILTSCLKIGRDANQVAVARFGEDIVAEFPFNKYLDKTNLLREIRSLKSEDNQRRMSAHSLNQRVKRLFTRLQGKRTEPHVTKIAIVITADLASDETMPTTTTTFPGEPTLYAIGAGSKINVAALQAATGGRTDRLFVEVDEREIHDVMPHVLASMCRDARNHELKVEAEEKVKSVIEFHSLDASFHLFSRTSPYPGAPHVTRFYIPDDRVDWSSSFPSYDPHTFTDPVILAKPPPKWADSVNLFRFSASKRPTLAFNEYDKVCEVDRRSYTGIYRVEEGVPINPQGRTGLRGRGCLGRWGPNASGDAVVTRWKRDPVTHRLVFNNGRKVLQFVATRHKNSDKWGLPGGLRRPGQPIHLCLQSEFTEEAMGNLESLFNEKKTLEEDLDLLFAHGVQVYQGYVDDPRNTDNAWIETMALNFHDDDGTLLRHFRFRAGDSAEAVTWHDLGAGRDYEPSTYLILRLTAKRHDASF